MTSWSLTDGTTAEKFGGLLGLTAGSTNCGHNGPTGYYSLTNLVFTADGGGSFSGAKVRSQI